MWISGCGTLTASTTTLRISVSRSATSLPFHQFCPAASTEMVMFCGLVLVGIFTAFGSVTGTVLVMIGMVIRKMISSTSMTSTSGVVLMSDMMPCSSSSELWTFIDMVNSPVAQLRALPTLLASGRAAAGVDPCAAHQVGVQIAGEIAQAVLQALVPAQQPVVAQHRAHRHEQADGRHDQRLADRAGDLVDARLAGDTDGDQRVENAHDGAKQADEGRGGS